MATRLKTVEYAFTTLASLANNTLTNLTQLTINLPESSKVFRSVVARISCDDIITATGGSITTKTFGLRVGGAAYTSVSQTQTITNSGENLSFFTSVNFTAQFSTNFTGTSHTCDFQLLLNQSTGTTLGMVNVCVTLEITYEYDDTSATQIKTIYYPLRCSLGAMPQATTTEDTIPALTTLLPEASKVFRNIFVVIQGNESRNTSTLDATMTLRVGAASVTTGNYEAALATNRFTRYVWNLTSSYPNTAASQTWQPTNSTGGMRHHQQAWLAVTYEYNEASTTRVMNSLMLPVEPSAIGNNLDSATVVRPLFRGVQEENVTCEAVAFYGFWHTGRALGAANAIVVLDFDSGGSPVSLSYTDQDGVFAGSSAFMNKRLDPTGAVIPGGADSQSIGIELYAATGNERLRELNGYFVVCYTSDKAPMGSGAHNHTVRLPLILPATGSPPVVAQSATAIRLIEHVPSSLFLANIGVTATMFPRTALPASGAVRMWANDNPSAGLNAVELDTEWSFIGDTEVGAYHFVAAWNNRFGDAASLFSGRLERSRLQIESEHWFNISVMDATAAAPAVAFMEATAVFTFHELFSTISGTITGATGDVEIDAEGTEAGSGTYVVAPATSYSFDIAERVGTVRITATDSAGNITWLPSVTLP